MKRLFAFLIIIALLPLPVSYAATGGMGEAYIDTQQSLCDGLVLRETHAKNQSGAQTAYTFTYTPGASTGIAYSCGSKLYGRESLDAMTERAYLNGKNTVGAISGGGFALQSGVPTGAILSDGALLCAQQYNPPAIGVTDTGKILSGSPEINISITTAAGTVTADSYNKPNSGVTLYSPAYATSTKTSGARIEIVLRTDSVSLSASKTIHASVREIVRGADTPIPAGCMVLSLPASHTQVAALAALTVGSTITVSTTFSGEWGQADLIIGTDKQILSAGRAVNTDTSALDRQTLARSAVGIGQDGTLAFFVCGAKQNTAHGLTTAEVAAELAALGIQTAYLLDSGTYTSALTCNQQERGTLIGTDSTHPIGGCILFINRNTDTTADRLRITPASPFAVSGGALIEFSCEAIDAAGNATGDTLSEITYTLDTPLGTLDGAQYRTGNASGQVTVRAQARSNGRTLNGSTVITVIPPLLDQIHVTGATLAVPTDGTALLPLIGYRDNLPVTLCASALRWLFSGVQELPADGAAARCTYGYLDNQLRFHATAGVQEAEFDLTAYHGYAAVTIHIIIGKQDEIITSFDDNSLPFPSYLVFRDTDTYRYAAGKHESYGLSYRGNGITYATPNKVEEGAKTITIWLKGTCPDPYVIIKDSDGILQNLHYTPSLDTQAYNGWVKYSAALPDRTTAIISPLCSEQGIDCTVDEITLTYGTPTYAFADAKQSWACDDMQLLYDLDLSSGYGTGSARVYRPQQLLTRAEFAKLITAYYRLDPAQYSDTPLDFHDSADIPSWAVPYIKAALANGQMRGSANPDGTLDFLPNAPITRAQVVTVVGRALDGAPAELTFTDADTIPEYAYDGVAKATGIGIIAGYPDGTFLPNGNVTRAEIARIIANLYRYVHL